MTLQQVATSEQREQGRNVEHPVGSNARLGVVSGACSFMECGCKDDDATLLAHRQNLKTHLLLWNEKLQRAKRCAVPKDTEATVEELSLLKAFDRQIAR